MDVCLQTGFHKNSTFYEKYIQGKELFVVHSYNISVNVFMKCIFKEVEDKLIQMFHKFGSVGELGYLAEFGKM